MQPSRPTLNPTLPPKWLVIAWLALPQIAETILAPALPDLAHAWRLDPAHTQWVMSVFFLGFSAGVLLWGQVSDRWGRRPALLSGLALALAGTLIALVAARYEWLLLGRFVQALGMATCSITTQTILRDRLSGPALTQYFVTLGIVLAWSPAVGPLAGQWLSDRQGYPGVLWAIAALVLCLMLSGARWLDETRPDTPIPTPLKQLALRMAGDSALWRAAALVAGLNTLVFSFYAAGPFMVGELPGLGFGWVGLAVAFAGSAGAAWNRRLPGGIDPDRRVRLGLIFVLLGVVGQLACGLVSTRPGALWAATALPVFAGFGLAIPNLLAPALRHYGASLGRAGALFGVTYYLMLGMALAATTLLPFDTPIALSAFWTCLAIAMFVLHRGASQPGAANAQAGRPVDGDRLGG
ncbi:multidrug effflux MFS transporter [Burkholderia sp. FERM BP-3421]|uniref:multidrug effflux MFS transporter n=1 Tax=Burkholderia sp. FERM BP-3421 TaxID=1494466 RepID=UPI0023628218|nr:multidrug effflux MFS transporter [Burkholderia sp. FERM BP-3421]WDD94149.1 multidrug effflux MFS transporter [Burkholderia sp. FERM BP-3421]